ncbi:heme ABC transporter ATP-binding protein [Sphingobacterium shayense]|uniref:heme ABC transporter ATP-binding protein n=1 Tax=Sphingobacterium shayense TaxID=626343 RepID=UPI001557EBBF|nr:heme ABC transporter ATP-binding protein [Sphingobacterium shayense]NQD69921.1 heme ABC transporter ATP-binding protein [Sphingobacterium shayense]
MIHAQDINYSIARRSLIKDVSFTAERSQILAIIGPNGAGKSTLLKLISKQLVPDSGHITIHNRRINALTHRELSTFRAVLPQSNHLNVNLTVFEIALMGRYPHFKSNPAPVDIEITNEALREMGMLNYKDRFIHQLSGGEQQRVQLARTLAQIYQNPKGILLMDEPITGLDLQYQQIILEKAQSLTRQGMTIISILHDINLAAQYADRILVLKNGQVMGIGAPKQILNEELIFNTYHTKVRKITDQKIGYPIIVPISH